MTDLQGRPWARIAEVKKGSILEHDNGSPCWRKGRRYKVHEGSLAGELYFKCRHGYHGSGQEVGDHYVGLYCVQS